MTVSYSSYVSTYRFNQVANDGAGSFKLELSSGAPVYLTEFEDAIKAFADSLNATYTIDSVTRNVNATGSDDWSYTPTS